MAQYYTIALSSLLSRIIYIATVQYRVITVTLLRDQYAMSSDHLFYIKKQSVRRTYV